MALSIFGAFFMLNSCQNDLQIAPSQENESLTGIFEDQTNISLPIGTLPKPKQVSNPYSIQNVRRVYERLGISFQPNLTQLHLSLRIDVSTMEEMNNLSSDSTIQFFDYPIAENPETTTRNDEDIQATLEIGEIPSLYSVIKLGQESSLSVPFEVLDTLYFPNDDEMDIEIETHEEVGIISPEQGNELYLFGFGKKTSGIVQVLDSRTNTLIGVPDAYVQAIHWGQFVGAHTGTDGRFTIHKRFVAGTHISVKFENNFCKIKQFDTSDGSIITIPFQLLLPAIHLEGFKAARDLGGMNITFSSNSQARYWSTMLVAVNRFHQFAHAVGIGKPNKLNIYAHWADNDGDASAPMLEHIRKESGTSLPTSELRTTLLKFFSDLSSGFSSNILDAIRVDLPDITFKKREEDPFDSQAIMNTMFHELAHTSHYKAVGSGFWKEYIRYIVANGGYGQQSSTGSGRIALSESWAETIGDRFTNMFYGGGAANNPMREERADLDETNRWIPYGIYWDLLDNTSFDEPVGVIDNVNGFALNQCYQALFPFTVDTPQKYRDRLLQITGNRQQAQVRELFRTYGYN